MQLKKILAAGTLAALMAGSSIALAADLSNYPQPFITADGAADFLVVVGAAANPSDVIGAVDVATRLGGETVTSQPLTGATTAVSLSGKSEEIPLDSLVVGTGMFPETLKHHHVPALIEASQVYWDFQTDDYIDTSEQFVLGSLNVTRNPAIYNGTISMTVPDPVSGMGNDKGNAAFYYVYKFDDTMEGQGNLSTTYPLKITLLGREFSITEIGSNYIIAMVGDQLDIEAGGTETTADGFSVSPWQFYPSDGAWDVTISKNNLSVTKKLTVGSSSDTDYVIGSETVKARVLKNQTVTTYVGGEVTSVNYVTVIVGVTTEVKYQEDVTYQANPSKTQGDNRFPGTDAHWRFDFTFDSSGTFARGDTIAVYYDPWDLDDVDESTNNGQPLNLTVGEKVSLPGNYFDVEFAAMNTETAANVIIDSVEKTLYYNGTGDTTARWNNLPAIKITTDKGRFLNATDCTAGEEIENEAVYIVYQNASADLSAVYLATLDSDGYLRNRSTAKDLNTTNTAMLTLDYGDYTNTITVTAMSVSNGNDILVADYLGDTVLVDFTVGPTNTTGYRIYMGDGVNDDPAAADVKVNGTNAATYRDFYTAYGVEVDNIQANAKTDRVVLNAPATQLKGIVAIGKDISVGGTGGGTYETATPIKTAVGMLDSEVTTADQSEKNIILVGGPCANTLVRTLLDSTEATCLSDFQDMGYTAGTAMIKYIEDAWGTGKAALIVAGYNAADTRAACAVLQDYDANTATLVGTEAVVA